MRAADPADPTGVGPPTVTVRYWAAARAAAGRDTDSVTAATLADALAAVRSRSGDRLAEVLAASSLLVNGGQVKHRDPASVVLEPGDVVEVLPPFAGG